MSQSSPNSNMTRSTVETLKQIQKQGLSVSIISAESGRAFTLDPSVSRETRSKQNVVMIDKSARASPRPPTTVQDNKTSLLQNRLVAIAEPRGPAGLSTVTSSQSTFLDKTTGSINRTIQSSALVSESKPFVSQSWSNPTSSTPTENKSQTSSTRMVQNIQVFPETKNQGRLNQNISTLSENKTQVSRNLQPENKVSRETRPKQGLAVIDKTARASPRPPSVQEGKAVMQCRITSISEPRVASGHSSVTTSQSSFIEKTTASVNRTNQTQPSVSESKPFVSQSWSNPNCSTASENKSQGTATRIMQNVSGFTENKTQGNLGRSGQSTASSESKAQANRSLQPENKVAPGAKISDLPTKSSAAFVFAENKKASNLGRLSQNVSTLSENKIQPSRNIQAENKVQGTKVSEVSSKSATAFDVSTESDKSQTGGNPSTLSSRVAAAKRAPVTRAVNEAGAPVAKKKCIKRNSASSERSGKGMLSPSDASSSDDGPPNEQQFFSSLKNRTPGLTITPVGPNTSTPISSTGASNKTEPSEKNTSKVFCPSCKSYINNPKWCQNCNINPSTIQFSAESEVMPKMSVPFLLTKNVTNVTVSKQIIFNPISNADLMNPSQSFHFQQATQRKIFIKSGTVIQTPTRSKGRPRARRKFEEPVCLTLSSDEEEPMQEPFVSMPDDSSSATFFQMESEGSKSEQSSPDMQQDDNQESDEPQFPGVTGIHPKQLEEEIEFEEEEEEQDEEFIDELELEDEDLGEEEEEEECLEEEEEEEEEVPPEDEIEDDVPKFPMDRVTNIDQPLRCRSIRIGSFKIHPRQQNAHIPIFLGIDAITFRCPVVTDANFMVPITLKSADVTCMLFHFGRCLPILFMFTTTAFAENVRKVLRMEDIAYPYFDPTSKDDKEQKITFLIETMTEDHRKFFRLHFPGEKKIKELDQKTANEILVKSTPNQPSSIIKIQSFPSLPSGTNQLQQIQVVAPLPQPAPVTKILTYPPPPQTGGIAITTGDLACLNEGEFLNDAIIDFYLKYVFYEKLSEYHREKTHIFSSFFYPRLTHKPERQRPSEDGQKTMQVRRHSQVKTWTRHVDIFSKDYIIIPINQNKHWFLAIICYPGRVPDVVNVPASKPEGDISKPADSVTSTDDQEETDKIATSDQNSSIEGNPNNDENSLPSSNNSLYDPEDSPDSEEPLPEAPDSSTHPDVNNRRKETPCICIFDSLSGPRWRLAATLREYLEMEWKMKKGTKKVFDRNTMQGFIMRCPQQTNYSDCGLYLLQYVESFFENPVAYFGNPMPDLSNWFSETKISKKRQELKELILNLKMLKPGNSPNSSARKVNQAESVPSSPASVQNDNR